MQMRPFPSGHDGKDEEITEGNYKPFYCPVSVKTESELCMQ